MFFFFFSLGPPVVVGMSINIASIDSISEVNMVSKMYLSLFIIVLLIAVRIHKEEPDMSILIIVSDALYAL